MGLHPYSAESIPRGSNAFNVDFVRAAHGTKSCDRLNDFIRRNGLVKPESTLRTGDPHARILSKTSRRLEHARASAFWEASIPGIANTLGALRTKS